VIQSLPAWISVIVSSYSATSNGSKSHVVQVSGRLGSLSGRSGIQRGTLRQNSMACAKLSNFIAVSLSKGEGPVAAATIGFVIEAFEILTSDGTRCKIREANYFHDCRHGFSCLSRGLQISQ
jgi:hypothetical protein